MARGAERPVAEFRRRAFYGDSRRPVKPIPRPPGGSAPGTTVADARRAAFDEAAIAGHVAAGRVVFVDVTADGCITCQVDETVAIEDAAVAARLHGDGVVAMRADWTRPDDAIAAFLGRFDRYGIPFNIAFGPAAPEGLPLPELLTAERLLDSLDRAAGEE